jgi:hypothetical protein
MIGGDDGEASVVCEPGKVGDQVICGSDGAFGFIGEGKKPEAGMFVVLVGDVGVVLVFFFFSSAGFGVGSEKRNGFTVVSPCEAADVTLPLVSGADSPPFIERR